MKVSNLVFSTLIEAIGCLGKWGDRLIIVGYGDRSVVWGMGAIIAKIEESSVQSCPMITQLMVQPSSFIRSGVQMSQLGEVYIFKFTDELQTRFEELLSKNKHDKLTQEEQAELDGISELSRIFTLINAQLATQAKWCPTQLENLSDNELNSSANIAIPPNT